MIDMGSDKIIPISVACAWHVFARDIVITRKYITKNYERRRIEVLNFYSEKKLFDTEEEMQRYIFLHKNQHNVSIHKKARLCMDDMYSITKINKKKVPTYKKIFRTAERRRTHHCELKNKSEDGVELKNKSEDGVELKNKSEDEMVV